jgi:hypothetical protein
MMKLPEASCCLSQLKMKHSDVIAVDVRYLVDKILKIDNFLEIYSSVILELFYQGSMV